MRNQDAASAERAAIEAHQLQNRPGRRRTVLGIDVSKYIGFRVPGVDNTKMFGDPTCILKDKSKPKESYVWRKPDDPYTVNMCNQQVLKAVTEDKLDTDSPYANVVKFRAQTSMGPRVLVRSPGGLGLFEIRDQEALNKGALANLPGKHWEDQYMSDLAGVPDQFDRDIESLSADGTSYEADFKVSKTQREPIV